MEKELLKVPATISKVTTMSDKGLRLQVDTQELGSEDKAEVMGMYGDLGVFVFSKANISPEDLVELPEVKLEKGSKTESQRLRATLFVYWQQKKLKEPFDNFYKRQMEKWIQSIKEQLE